VNELFADSLLCEQEKVVRHGLNQLRRIGMAALDMIHQLNTNLGWKLLKRTLRLFHKAASSSQHDVPRRLSNVANELQLLLTHTQQTATDYRVAVSTLITFLAEEAMPHDFLTCLAQWTKDNHYDEDDWDIITVLQTLLRRGSHVSVTDELSDSFFRLKQARLSMKSDGAPPSPASVSRSLPPNTVFNENERRKTIWEQMAEGMLVIDK
jgi:hypothetical protein